MRAESSLGATGGKVPKRGLRVRASGSRRAIASVESRPVGPWTARNFACYAAAKEPGQAKIGSYSLEGFARSAPTSGRSRWANSDWGGPTEGEPAWRTRGERPFGTNRAPDSHHNWIRFVPADAMKEKGAAGELSKGKQLTISKSAAVRLNAAGERRPERLPNCQDIEPVRIHYVKRKRLLDIFGSLALLLLFAPVMIVISILVKLTSRGPVLYVSDRVGQCGRVFRFYKFRSMYMNAEERLKELQARNEKDGPIFKMKKDPRITPLGHFLRRTSMDELPQLFNVLKGEMSLVGPRPPIPSEVLQYDDWTKQRLAVRPGITCYWQIMGRSNLGFREWIELDLKYIREMGVFNDLWILLKTPIAVLKGDGAY